MKKNIITAEQQNNITKLQNEMAEVLCSSEHRLQFVIITL